MPIEQDQDSPRQSPTVLNWHHPKCLTIPTNHHGLDHGAPTLEQKGCNPDYSGSRVLKGSSITAMHHHHHGAAHSPTIHGTYLPMVWTTPEDDQ
jgi:hypothetical protein